jgi:hypothetical protein
MSVSRKIRELARDGVSTTEIAKRLGIRYQHAYNVLRADRTNVAASKSDQNETSLDLTDALVLVSCVSQKLAEPAPARLLYKSEWFNKVRALVDTRKADWLILSALYGLIPPDACIAPYEKTLNTVGIVERRNWAENIYRQLTPIVAGRQRVVIFAGQRYREFLLPALLRDGLKVDVPMANLRIGEQLAWLAAQS